MSQGGKLARNAAGIDLMRKKLAHELAHVVALRGEEHTLLFFQKFGKLTNVSCVSDDGKGSQSPLNSQILNKAPELDVAGFRRHDVKTS